MDEQVVVCVWRLILLFWWGRGRERERKRPNLGRGVLNSPPPCLTRLFSAFPKQPKKYDDSPIIFLPPNPDI